MGIFFVQLKLKKTNHEGRRCFHHCLYGIRRCLCASNTPGPGNCTQRKARKGRKEEVTLLTCCRDGPLCSRQYPERLRCPRKEGSQSWNNWQELVCTRWPKCCRIQQGSRKGPEKERRFLL